MGTRASWAVNAYCTETAVAAIPYLALFADPLDLALFPFALGFASFELGCGGVVWSGVRLVVGAGRSRCPVRARRWDPNLPGQLLVLIVNALLLSGRQLRLLNHGLHPLLGLNSSQPLLAPERRDVDVPLGRNLQLHVLCGVHMQGTHLLLLVAALLHHGVHV